MMAPLPGPSRRAERFVNWYKEFDKDSPLSESCLIPKSGSLVPAIAGSLNESWEVQSCQGGNLANVKRFGFLREVLFFVFFLFLSVLNTWPLTRNLQSAVWDPGDPFLTAWFMEWDWWATMHRPLSLFHAPIFHPARYAHAFSEHIYGIAMPFFPL